MRASRRRSRALVALSVTAALMAAGCGSSGDSSSDTTAASSGGAATTAASGGAETTAAGGAATTAAAAAGGDLDRARRRGQGGGQGQPDRPARRRGPTTRASCRASATSTRASRTRSPTRTRSSDEELDAVQTLAGQADMPDSVDVSPAIAQAMVDGRSVRAVQADHVIDEIPDGLEGPRQQLGRRPTTASWRSSPTRRSCRTRRRRSPT